jgi:hypothetical protein
VALTQIDYTSTPLPSNGNPRSAPALAAIYQNIQTVYNGMATTATSGNSASSPAQRDVNGGIQFTYVGLIPTGALSGINVAAPTGYTGVPFTYSVNSVARITIGNDGSITAAAGFHGPADSVAALGVTTAAIAANAVTGAKIGLGPNGVALGNIADGAVSAQVTPNMSVNVAGYSYYSTTNAFSTVSGSSPTYPALPTVGNQRYDLLYTDDAFTLGWLVGVAAVSSPALPTLTIGSTARPLAWVGPVTSATTAITAGMIFNARPSPTSGGGSGGGGGGGGSGMSTADRAIPFVTVGSDPGLTAETDIAVYLGDGRGTSTLKTGTTDGILGDLLRIYVPADIPARIEKSGGATMRVKATTSSFTPGPASIATGGHWKTNTVAVTATATGSAGTRYVIADLAPSSPPTGAQWTLVDPMPTSPTTNSNQVLLKSVWFDATTIQDGIADLSQLANVSSTQVGITSFYALNTGSDTIAASVYGGNGGTVLLRPTNMGASIDFYLPVSMLAKFRHSALFISSAVGQAAQYTFADIALSLNGSAYSSSATSQSRIYFGQCAVSDYEKNYGFCEVVLQPGRWSFTQIVGYTGLVGDTTSFLANAREVYCELWKAAS